MIRDDIGVERLDLLRQAEAATDRSQQVGIGWSGIGSDCARQVWSHAHGVPKVNDRQRILAALRGHAVHEYVGPAFLDSGWQVETPVEYRGIPGHVDLYRDGVVEDIKTCDADKARAMELYGPQQAWRVQVHGYAAGLVEQGHAVHTVRIVAYAIDSSEKVVVWEESFDRAVADEFVDRYERLAEQAEPPLPAKEPEFCQNWCGFYDAMLDKGGCPSRLLGDTDVELADPILVSAVHDMREAREDAKKAADRKAAAASVLHGQRGVVDGLLVRTVVREGSASVDVAALDLDAYEAIVGPVPMKTSGGSSYVSISKARRSK